MSRHHTAGQNHDMDVDTDPFKTWKMIKSQGKLVARIGQKRYAYRNFVVKPEGKRQLERLNVGEKII